VRQIHYLKRLAGRIPACEAMLRAIEGHVAVHMPSIDGALGSSSQFRVGANPVTMRVALHAELSRSGSEIDRSGPGSN
jgi:hypothetical protein